MSILDLSCSYWWAAEWFTLGHDLAEIAVSHSYLCMMCTCQIGWPSDDLSDSQLLSRLLWPSLFAGYESGCVLVCSLPRLRHRLSASLKNYH